MLSERVLGLRLCCALALVGLLLFGGCKGKSTGESGASGAESDLSKSDIEKFNYALGTSFGAMLEAQEMGFDAKQFVRGVEEQLAGKASMTPEQASTFIDSLFMRKRALEAEKQAIKGAHFLDSIGRLDGVVRDSTGLLYRVVEQGSGAFPTEGSTVEVFYVGRLIDGTEFDANRTDIPTRLNLQGVIKGWAHGLQKVKEGGKIELFIPPQLAYGERGGGPIPGNSTLCFEVHLVNIVDDEAEVVAPR